MRTPSEGNSSFSSPENLPKEDVSDTHSERDAKESDQGQSSGSQPRQPPSTPLYYTRRAARSLPPPSPDQLRAGKLLIKYIDHRPHRSPRPPRPLTVVKQTTTSRIKPPVPPAQPSASGIVPLGPPPPRDPRRPKSPPPRDPRRPKSPKPREPRRTKSPPPREPRRPKSPPPREPRRPKSPPPREPRRLKSPPPREPRRPKSPPPREPRRLKSPPPAAPMVGRFDHLPPPHLSFVDAWKITQEFVEGLEKKKDELDVSKLKDLMLALQVDLGLPPEVCLFDMLDSNGEDLINFVCGYFQTSEAPPADDDK